MGAWALRPGAVGLLALASAYFAAIRVRRLWLNGCCWALSDSFLGKKRSLCRRFGTSGHCDCQSATNPQTTPPPQESAMCSLRWTCRAACSHKTHHPFVHRAGRRSAAWSRPKHLLNNSPLRWMASGWDRFSLRETLILRRPLSTDAEALALFVRNATPDFVGEQGTDFTPTLQPATRLFDSNSEAGRALILISDGEQQAADASDLAQKYSQKSASPFTRFRAGTPSGTTIPDGAGGYTRWKAR